MRIRERQIKRVLPNRKLMIGRCRGGSRPSEVEERRLFKRMGGGKEKGSKTTRRENVQRRGIWERMIRFDNIPPEIARALCTPMHEILLPPPAQHLGHLWLGSFAAISDNDLLRKHRISHVVQVIDVAWLPQVNDPNMTVTRIDIVDTPSADLKSHLDETCARIDKSLASGKNVLVHCQQVCLNPSLPNSPPPSRPSQGHISQRFCRNRISHQKIWHVIRLRIRLCKEAPGLHRAQLWLRKVPQGVGDQTATAYNQVPDRVCIISLSFLHLRPPHLPIISVIPMRR